MTGVDGLMHGVERLRVRGIKVERRDLGTVRVHGLSVVGLILVWWRRRVDEAHRGRILFKPNVWNDLGLVQSLLLWGLHHSQCRAGLSGRVVDNLARRRTRSPVEVTHLAHPSRVSRRDPGLTGRRLDNRRECGLLVLR